ncbi:hypothetical protein [Streptomyces diacarni]|uniref:hypothetical protein n=1 Tax=Streptomyces diacarni TaxID=2800381 RepID=UPI002482E226|nr:hypothetical protein [Streptomyces diacarni]
MGADAERAPVPERPSTPPRPAAPPRPSRAPADVSHATPPPSVPTRPAAPPRPAVPPRPSVPPRPAFSLFSAPRPTGGQDSTSAEPNSATVRSGGDPDEPGEEAVLSGGVQEEAVLSGGVREETGGEPEAEPTPEDESSEQMPHPRENTEETEAERSGRTPVTAPGDRSPALRPPVPASPPQPAPPTGEPLTAPRLPALPPQRPHTGRRDAARRPPGNPEPNAVRTSRPGDTRSGPATAKAATAPPRPGTEAARTPAPPTGPPRATPPAPPAGPTLFDGASRAVPPETVPQAPAASPVHEDASGAGGGRSAGRSPLAVRTVVAAVCLVLGVGLLGGSGAGLLLSGDTEQRPALAQGFDGARAAWHEIPVDDLFPRTLQGKGAGPGGADRRWTRVAVAPDSTCAHAFDPLLSEALAPVGCARLIRATYTDETTSRVTTVGLMFTKADPAAMRDLRKRFATQNLTERTDLMPRPYAARGTVAADFGDAQRASWSLHVLQDVPVVVYSVSGFADGRVVTDPQPAGAATRKGETSAAAQAGLGHDAQGIADRVEQRLRKATIEGHEDKDEFPGGPSNDRGKNEPRSDRGNDGSRGDQDKEEAR